MDIAEKLSKNNYTLYQLLEGGVIIARCVQRSVDNNSTKQFLKSIGGKLTKDLTLKSFNNRLILETYKNSNYIEFVAENSDKYELYEYNHNDISVNINSKRYLISKHNYEHDIIMLRFEYDKAKFLKNLPNECDRYILQNDVDLDLVFDGFKRMLANHSVVLEYIEVLKWILSSLDKIPNNSDCNYNCYVYEDVESLILDINDTFNITETYNVEDGKFNELFQDFSVMIMSSKFKDILYNNPLEIENKYIHLYETVYINYQSMLSFEVSDIITDSIDLLLSYNEDFFKGLTNHKRVEQILKKYEYIIDNN